MAVRQTRVAGTFFPNDQQALDRVLGGYDNDWQDMRAGLPSAARAVIAPHAGYDFSGKLAAAAWAALSGADPARIAILSPSHHEAFDGIAVPTIHDAVEVPRRRVRIDSRACAALIRSDMAHGREAAFEREHGIDTQLPFARHHFPKVPVVPMVIGNATEGQVAAAIDRLCRMQGETLFVLSSDLSHFLTQEQALRIDTQTAGLIEAGQGARLTPAHACGARALSGWLASQAGAGCRPLRLGMHSSFTATQDASRVVGYGAWGFFAPQDDILDNASRAALLSLARAALGSRLARGCSPEIDVNSFAVQLRTLMASFVTLERSGQLRGCVGSMAPHRPLAADVAANAVKAGFEDPRFAPISGDEIDALDIKIAVLTRPAPLAITSEADLLEALVPHETGVILGDGDKRGVLLPSVWAGVPNPRDFLAALKRKAGLAPDHWSDSLQVQTFRTEVVTSRAQSSRAA
ncbi:AmmeMemoRadiSam system protein A [Tropicibacter oceani]|uniref:AmmeMemoRadiSam system protein A n=1 Tax=Tropicibacter oceani TaxID=3058420 RepID=A0ABY8QDX7_9RHOB|nr:AmmeMemoRadiSam system protein A [Tropicibacter oceani]WGW02710.1 AmmeMemoRadiSam system protein A [Tropicibacter oceani]